MLPGEPEAEPEAAPNGATSSSAAAAVSSPPPALESDLERAAAAGRAARVKAAGARALPERSRVRRTRAPKTIFVVVRGAKEAGRVQCVVYADWTEARYLVCTAAGNLDSGSVFHGFSTVEEAAAYWRAAVGDQPWPLSPGRPWRR